MPSCCVFKQSFNRPNLYYEVRSKGAISWNCWCHSILIFRQKCHWGNHIYAKWRNEAQEWNHLLQVFVATLIYQFFILNNSWMQINFSCIFIMWEFLYISFYNQLQERLRGLSVICDFPPIFLFLPIILIYQIFIKDLLQKFILFKSIQLNYPHSNFSVFWKC